jgi:hypothetical protein
MHYALCGVGYADRCWVYWVYAVRVVLGGCKGLVLCAGAMQTSKVLVLGSYRCSNAKRISKV